MTFIKGVLRDRCLRWWGRTCRKVGERGALDQTYKCLNKQLGRFSFFEPLKGKPHCDRHRDYNHLAASLLHPLPQTFNHG